jgi:hypothetical protein
MGYSFYRFKELYDKGGELALQEITEADPEEPDGAGPRTGGGRDGDRAAGLGPGARLGGALKRRGLSISPAGVRCVWQRHDLTSMKHRRKALDAKAAQEGTLLTEAQIAALEKAKVDKEAHGEFESECPGHCGAQDTFYMSAPSREWGGSISRPSSTPMPKWPSPSCTIARRRSPRPRSSMTGWCRFTTSTVSGYAGC